MDLTILEIMTEWVKVFSLVSFSVAMVIIVLRLILDFFIKIWNRS